MQSTCIYISDYKYVIANFLQSFHLTCWLWKFWLVGFVVVGGWLTWGVVAAPACLQPVDTGSYKCGRPTRRWRYSVHDANCIGFVYQGCGGNDNNFINFEECAERCKVSRHNGIMASPLALYDIGFMNTGSIKYMPTTYFYLLIFKK